MSSMACPMGLFSFFVQSEFIINTFCVNSYSTMVIVNVHLKFYLVIQSGKNSNSSYVKIYKLEITSYSLDLFTVL